MTETFLSRMQFKVHLFCSHFGYGLGTFRHPMRRDVLRACRETFRQIPAATTPLEGSEIVQWLSACDKIPGDIAELGVYNGATAALMLKNSGKRMHLFDTFEGLPESENRFEKGEYKGSLATVRRNLSQWQNRTEYHVGLFPASADGIETRFSFVHLDADLYSSTKSALEWFWPRISQGGAILSHDYPLSDGVVRAFQEFFENRPEIFVPLSGSQCVAIKSH